MLQGSRLQPARRAGRGGSVTAMRVRRFTRFVYAAPAARDGQCRRDTKCDRSLDFADRDARSSPGSWTSGRADGTDAVNAGFAAPGVGAPGRVAAGDRG